MTTKISDADWLKLRDFNHIISKNIKKRLPEDWDLTLDEIQSVVNGTFVQLLNNYREGAMSPTSYCWQFAERVAYNTLISEYRRLKAQWDFDDLFGEDKDDDEPCKHKVVDADIQRISVSERHTRENRMLVDQIIQAMPKIDQMIAQMIMEGYSEREVAKELGFESKTSVVKRMKKYGKLFERR